MITLGLTCISEELKEKDKKKYSFQTMTRKRFHALEKQQAINQLSERILHNAIATRYIINHCALNNILHYRLSSALLAHEYSSISSIRASPHPKTASAVV